MKKYIKLFLLVLVISLTSCKKDINNWSTQAVDFAGKFITKCYKTSTDTLLFKYNTEETKVYISNTSADTKEQLLVRLDYLGIISKFDITGDPSSFKSVSDSFDKCYDNVATVKRPSGVPLSETEADTVKNAIVKVALVSSSIKKGGYTTIAGNVTDKLDMELKCYIGDVIYKAAPEKEGSKYFKWVLDKVEKNTTEEPIVYIIEGFKHTGFHEDDLK